VGEKNMNQNNVCERSLEKGEGRPLTQVVDKRLAPAPRSQVLKKSLALT